ncbi:hypothetical protein D3C73_1072890 [compost metagenome]
MKRRAGIHRRQRQQQSQQAVTHVMRMVATTAKHPTQRAKHGGQRQCNPNAGQNIFANARAGQTVGQRVQNCIVDAVAGEIVAGIQRDIQDNKNPQHR